MKSCLMASAILAALTTSAVAAPARWEIHGLTWASNTLTGPQKTGRIPKGIVIKEQRAFKLSQYKSGPRPRRWCGWWMRTQFGGGPEYNIAWNWRKRGSSSGPHIGAIVIWRHHVGVIVGRASNGQWIVKSGNDSNRVRTRARSVKGAIFRSV